MADWITSDAFTKRESAAEELYIRQEEKAKYVHKPMPNAPPAPQAYNKEAIGEQLQ